MSISCFGIIKGKIMKKFLSILFALGLLLTLCGPSDATIVCYADGKLCINTTTGEISLDGVVFYTKAADGANRLTVSNNTAIAPTAATMELYPEAGVWKLNNNGTEKTIAYLESPPLVTPSLGAATATSLASTGIVSGAIGVITKSGAYTLGTDSANELKGYLVLATAAMTLTLPDLAVGDSF
jgi:hypothetical protein